MHCFLHAKLIPRNNRSLPATNMSMFNKQLQAELAFFCRWDCCCRRMSPLLMMLKSSGALPGSTDQPTMTAAAAARLSEAADAAAKMLCLFAAHAWSIGQTDDVTQAGSGMQPQLLQLQALQAAAGMHMQQQMATPGALAAAAAASASKYAPAEAAAAAAAALAGQAVTAVQSKQHVMAPQMLSLEAPLLAYSC
jgi:hypothetical protein